MNTPRNLFERRKARVRSAIKAAANGKLRLSIFRSGKHIYAQIIDDVKGITLVSASTQEAAFEGSGGNVVAAKRIGELIAQRALAKQITDVVFDRGGYLYHGRIQALADGAREAGLKF